MPVIFKAPTQQSGVTFPPTIAIAFEDAGAEEFFTAVGFADATTDKPVMTYPAGSVGIDPLTVHGRDTAIASGAQAGDHVLPDAAAAQLAAIEAGEAAPTAPAASIDQEG